MWRGRTRDEAEQILADIYLNSPVIVYHWTSH